jgi:hypothetical protein
MILMDYFHLFTLSNTSRLNLDYSRTDLARRVKNVDDYKKILVEKFFQQCQDNFLTLLK